jgi:hypothetical protein
LDNNEYVEVTPEALQLRQIEPGQTALGITVPAKDEQGNDVPGYRPFIHYAVDIAVPKTPVEQTINEAEKSIRKGKKKAARVN